MGEQPEGTSTEEIADNEDNANTDAEPDESGLHFPDDTPEKREDDPPDGEGGTLPSQIGGVTEETEVIDLVTQNPLETQMDEVIAQSPTPSQIEGAMRSSNRNRKPTERFTQ